MIQTIKNGFIEYLSGNINSQKKKLQDFQKFIDIRASIEDTYHKSMQKLYDQIHHTYKEANYFQVMKANIHIKMNEAKQLSQQLKEDINENIKKELFKNQQQYKELINKQKQNENRILKLKDNNNRFFQFYINKSQIYEDCLLIDQCYQWNKQMQSDSYQEIYQQHKQRLQQVESETCELFQKYDKSIQDHNIYVDEYNQSIRFIYSQIYDIIQNQEDLMKSSLVKFMIFEISSYRNLLYEFDRIVNDLDLYDTSKLCDEIKEQDNQNYYIHYLNVINYKGFVYNTITHNQKDQPQIDQQQQVQNGKSNHDSQQDSNTQQTDLDNELIMNFKYVISNLESEIIFTKETRRNIQLILGQYFQLMMYYLVNLKSQNKLECDYVKFENMAFIFECLLDIFYDNRNIVTVHQIFQLSSLIYQKKRRSIDLNRLKKNEDILEQLAKESKFEKMYLINRIKKHSIWKQQEFWKSFLILQIYQLYDEMKEKQRNNNQQDVESMIQKNIIIQIFDQMAFVSQQMLFFDVNREEVKRMINKFAKLIQISDFQQKILLNTIDNINMKKSMNDYDLQIDIENELVSEQQLNSESKRTSRTSDIDSKVNGLDNGSEYKQNTE